MFYFKENANEVLKYQVEFDKEKIEKLERKIIYNCSLIEHEEYETDFPPDFSNKIIKNFKCADTKKNQEYFEETRKVYSYSYDVYTQPYLISLIDKMLDGDALAIDEILNYDTSDKLMLDSQINFLNQEIIKLAPDDIKARKRLLLNLENLLEIKELNKDQQDIKPYYNELVESINFILVDSLPISEKNRVEDFFETNIVKSLKK